MGFESPTSQKTRFIRPAALHAHTRLAAKCTSQTVRVTLGGWDLRKQRGRSEWEGGAGGAGRGRNDLLDPSLSEDDSMQYDPPFCPQDEGRVVVVPPAGRGSGRVSGGGSGEGSGSQRYSSRSNQTLATTRPLRGLESVQMLEPLPITGRG